MTVHPFLSLKFFFVFGDTKVRDLAREAVLKMDLSAKEAYDLCKRSFEEGWVRVGDDTDSSEGDWFGWVDLGSVRFDSIRFGSVQLRSVRFSSGLVCSREGDWFGSVIVIGSAVAGVVCYSFGSGCGDWLD